MVRFFVTFIRSTNKMGFTGVYLLKAPGRRHAAGGGAGRRLRGACSRIWWGWIMAQRNAQAARARFRPLYDRYYKAVYHTALGILHDAAEAEDCGQETFAALWNALLSGGDLRNPGGWLLRVCRNVSLNALRRTRRLSPLDEAAAFEAAGHQAENRLEEDIYIAQILACLPALEREIFTLHVTAGLRHAEIARMLGIPAATVRWRYANARKLLQARLQEEGDIA